MQHDTSCLLRLLKLPYFFNYALPKFLTKKQGFHKYDVYF